MKKYLLIIAIVFFLFPVLPAPAEDSIHISFINPGYPERDNPTGGFWLSVSKFMKAAAEDLNIELEILYSNRDRFRMQKHAERIAARKNRPDYLIVVNEQLAASNMIKETEAAGIKVFLMLNRFEAEQSRKMGQPREIYKHWIGSLIPDNRYAGYQIARLVIEASLKANVLAGDGRLHLAGFSGDYVTQASVERVEGLKRAVSEYPNVDLKQVIPCDWSQDKAEKKAPWVLKRYPKLGAIWCANDPIALGAIAGAKTTGRIPGKDIFFGGLNWDPPGLEKIKSGEMVTSLGGHFMTGGWALILLHDYHHGKDFIDEGLELQYQIFEPLHSGNIDAFMTRFGNRNWRQIDFTRFSKILNPSLENYHFSLSRLLSQESR